MCRPKPGPRCPSCQNRALASISGRLERLAATLNDTPPGPARVRMEARARDLARQVACRRADLYATAAFQREQSAELGDLLAANPKDPKAAALAAQLLEGRILELRRREQARAMPPTPDDPAAHPYHRELGDARFDLAHAQLRMDMTRTTAEWQVWQKRHHDSAQRAALAAARMEAVAAGGTDGWTSLSREEQQRRRDLAAADPTLATPVAPRRWKDVVDEAQDVLDGHTPVREPLDASGYPPFGDAHTAGTQPAADTSSPPDSTPATEPAPASPTGRNSPEPRTVKAQAARRTRRRRSTATSFRSLRTGSRRLEAGARRADSEIDSSLPSSSAHPGVFDLTLLDYLIEKVK